MDAKFIVGCLAGAALIHAVLAACSGAKAANADPSAPVEVATESCNQSFQVQAPPGAPDQTSTTIYYAVHAYPGRTKNDLAGRVTNWVSIGALGDQNLRPTGFDLEPQLVMYVADGMVGAPCGGPGQTTTFIYAP